MPTEIYDKTTPMVGRRLRKITAAVAANMVKLGSNLYSSRAADGALAFIGPNIANITGTNTVAISAVQAGNSFNNPATRTFSKGGSWPAWLTLNAGTGAITGTAATGTTTGLTVICTTVGFGSAVSNPFNVTIT